MALSARFDLVGGSMSTNVLDLSVSSDLLRFGQNTLSAFTLAFDDGTPTGAVYAHWSDRRSLAAAAGESLDLAGGLTGPFGAGVLFTRVNLVFLRVAAPDGTKAVRIGPQGVANAAQLWLGDASDYDVVHHAALHYRDGAGWPVAAGTGDLLRLSNPGATGLSYEILLIGRTD